MHRSGEAHDVREREEVATCEPDEAGAPRLEYAPSTPWYRRRRWVRLMVWSALVIAIGVPVYLYWPEAQRRWTFVQSQRPFLSHTAAAPGGGRVVLTQDEGDEFAMYGVRVLGNTPDPVSMPLAQFASRHAGARLQGQDILFLHERTSPGGNRRLVVVMSRVSWFPEGTEVGVTTLLLEPGTFRRPQVRALDAQAMPPAQRRPGLVYKGWPNQPNGIVELFRTPWGRSFTLSTGRPDLDDSSAFLIDYIYDNQPGTIVGRLHDDDSLTFEGLPAATPSSR